MNKIILCLSIVLFCSCEQNQDHNLLDIQGHRGCRGLLPENTIPSFLKAIDIGVTTIEMDIVISGDGHVIVSHESYMNHEICTKPSGDTVSRGEESSYNLYEMVYDSIRLYDVGMKTHPRFKGQQKIQVFKPLLSAAIDSIEAHIMANKLNPIQYNIEIKSSKFGDNRYHPEPEEYVDRLVSLVKKKGILDRVIIQSFDFRILRQINSKYPGISSAALIERDITPEKVMEELGYKPEVYSPDFNIVNENWLLFCNKNNIKLIPWTINDPEDLLRAIDLGVDGIITDYPDRLVEIISTK